MTKKISHWGLGVLLCASLLSSCQRNAGDQADLLVYNANVYTVDDQFAKAEAIAVKDGKILAVGTTNDLRKKYKATEEVDAQGKSLYPGFIDAHAHFVGYATNQREADLVGTTSFAEVVQRLQAHRKEYPSSAWLTGRGWDQNDWQVKQFPTKDTLDKLFPDTPVIIERVDGHASLANQKALDLAGITTSTPVQGGKIEQQNGKLTGILVDRAADQVVAKIPTPTVAEYTQVLKEAEQNLFAVGLTSVVDAGLPKSAVNLIDSLQKKNELKIRVYAMLNPSKENRDHYFKSGPYSTDRLTVKAFKVYADGALGSRGACLLHPYTDRPGETGFLLQTVQEYKDLAAEIYKTDFQMNTHAIGDSANRVILQIYGNLLKGKNDRRWRIEHAQVVNPVDVPLFGKYSILPSVQPTHATSDMYWAGERLGMDRLKHAYAFKALLQQNNMIPLGSDFPVEHINPLYGFHAAVARQDAKNYPKGGFQMDNALTREEALRGTTIWAAFANFEEKQKGSLEPGKVADFVILEKDIMTVAPEELRDVKVLSTYVNGEKVYGKK
ncbi:amidohydrolase family protein [Nibribacter ruber]|uniref:Amidohydrolase family protein n=1 Tax=Nibribacter ruber TaxID=2698458 RepID=A0A6P1P016_9BACT|nr:amidohydrolase [Nibribacter ruber]QHL86633.1 amidohydrolase family protein [Nibribacter ruber]